MGKTKIELEPYWKINGIYSIDVYVDLDAGILQKEVHTSYITITNRNVSHQPPHISNFPMPLPPSNFLIKKRPEMIKTSLSIMKKLK